MNRIRGAVSSVASAPTYRFLQAGIFVVLGIAFATSFSSGSSGAEILGYQLAFVSSVPLICDIVAALAMVVHGRVRDDRPMRRLAAWFVLVPMLLSWGANALDHLRRTPAQPHWPGWSQWAWIGAVVVFAGLAPVAVAGLLHFMARYVEFEKRVAADPAAEKSQESATTTADTAETDEPEFVEPARRVPALAARPAVVETVPEVDAETVKEIDEIEVHRANREVAEISAEAVLLKQAVAFARRNPARPAKDVQSATGVSRATAYRAVKLARETNDETAASA